MAMKRGRQTEWPREKRTPIGDFVNPDGYQQSARGVAGPLRMGTSPGVGPRGFADTATSDMELDRVSPRGFDPMGTSDTRAPLQEGSSLLSRQIRRRER